jgi:membrane-anchored protein YejM (alkaline phosphatase superfamily)
VRQHVIANEMADYAKYYFLGGSASWGEIRGLLSTNIEDLRIYEEGSYAAPRVDVWGISDLNLFKEANKVLTSAGPEPFLAIVQTSGNHRPYTIPDDNDGFKVNPIDDETAQRYGFRSADAYNSYRFMDHSIGRFMEIASREDYFDNTVFLFFGDHGLVRHAEHRPAYEHELIMSRYHVPLLIYAPTLLPNPAVIDNVASEVDVMPTIAGMTGRPYINTTFGRDLFDPQYDDDRYAFTILHGPVPRLGLIGADFYFNINGDGTAAKLFKLDPQAPIEDRSAEFPEIAAQMRQLCLGIYESARYVRYHNKPEDIASAFGIAASTDPSD